MVSVMLSGVMLSGVRINDVVAHRRSQEFRRGGPLSHFRANSGIYYRVKSSSLIES